MFKKHVKSMKKGVILSTAVACMLACSTNVYAADFSTGQGWLDDLLDKYGVSDMIDKAIDSGVKDQIEQYIKDNGYTSAEDLQAAIDAGKKELQDQLDKNNIDMNKLKEDLAKAEQDLKDLAADNEAANNALNKAKEDLEKAKAEAEQAVADLEAANQAKAEAEQAKADAEAAKLAAEQAKAEAEAAQNASEEEKAAAQAKADAAEKAAQEAQAKADAAQSAADQAVKDAQANLAAKEEAVKDLTSQLANSQELVDNLKAQAEAAAKQYADQLAQSEALQGQLAEVQKQLEDYKALNDVLKGENLDLNIEIPEITKTGDGTTAAGPRVIEQKQDGLYAVLWHPLGGTPTPEDFIAVYELIKDMDAVELRIDPDEQVYIINLTGAEAEKVLAATANGAQNIFETSVSCVGATICQQGVRDSAGLLLKCIEATREAGLPCGALPVIHISGCPSSCGTHQTAALGFRGGVKLIDKVAHPAFVFYVNGCSLQGKEAMGREVGTMLEAEIPAFLVELGKTVAASGMKYNEWNAANPTAIDEIAAKYVK